MKKKVLHCLAKDGQILLTEKQNEIKNQFALDNPGRVTLTLDKEYVESPNQRAFYHGAVIPIWTFLDGKDYHDSSILDDMHDIAKLEFNKGVMIVNGKAMEFGRSSKGELNNGFIDKVVDYLIDEYSIDPIKVLNPDRYKDFMARIWPYTKDYEDYIDYLIKMGDLKAQ